MKRFIVFFFLLTQILISYAKIDCVVVFDTNEDSFIIPIEDAQEIRFNGKVISIGSHDFNMDLVKRYTFADSHDAGIEEIVGENTGLKIDPKGLFTFDHNLPSYGITVTDVNGIEYPFSVNGNSLDIRNLPSQIYIIRVNTTSIKLLKK